MNAETVLPTAGLLGLFVIFAGFYALFYAAGRMQGNSLFTAAGYLCYASQIFTVVLLWSSTPLSLPWKILMAGAAVVCSFIPKLSWRYIRLLHEI